MFFYEVKLAAAVKQWLTGSSASGIMSQNKIKGSATLYEWVRLFNSSGAEELQSQRRSSKTYYPYSFKMEVIRWRQIHLVSLPVAARHFNLRALVMISEWEKALNEGHLKLSKGRPSKLTKTNDQEDDELQKLKDENEILKLRNAHLENLSALAQKKRKSQIKKRSK